MIRDPSDGSVREAPPKQIRTPTGFAEKPAGEISGLRGASPRPKMQERLERSRKWLQDYYSKRGISA